MDENNVTEVNNKINRLIDRFFMGKVVPFAGAGISINAEYKDKRLADTNIMTKTVAKKLFDLYDKKEQWAKWCRCSLKCKNHKETMCLLKKQSLDKLCEIYTWATGEKGFRSLVEKVLSIPDFSKLSPQAAHRYISLLAREELIDEIITTNYDCCFEKAYQQTFKDRPTDAALVITDLDGYRQFSGRFYTKSGNRCLKIYKINGCAGKLKQNKNYPTEHILLMERQLQNWRERKWARDLFNDCLRSRTLVFSGFGSEEPQVRHTALQIAEEFEITGNNKPENNQGSCWDLPNAPFIAAFDETLSFNQIQILYAYADAHNGSLEYAKIHTNVFIGADTKFFEPNNGNKDEKDDRSTQTLPADLFWKKVYQAAFWRLFKEQCKQDAPFYAYLSSCIYPIDALLFNFNNWLIPDDTPFGRFSKLLEIDENKGVNVLTKWLNCIRHGSSRCVKGLYLPLKEKPVLLPLLLLILFFVAGDKDKWEDLNCMVEAKNDLFTLNAIENLPVYIVHNTLLIHNVFKNKSTWRKKNIGFAIIISDKLEEQAEVIHENVYISESSSEQTLKKINRVTIYKLPFRDIFCFDSIIPKSVDSLRKKFFASFEDAKLIITNARPSVKRRAKKIL